MTFPPESTSDVFFLVLFMAGMVVVVMAAVFVVIELIRIHNSLENIEVRLFRIARDLKARSDRELAEPALPDWHQSEDAKTRS